MKSFKNLAKEIDWEDLSVTNATGFHGDFHFENILKTDTGYSLLDWRQDFSGSLEYGDIYYDLAKLLHGLIISHSIIKEDLFSIILRKNKKISLDFNRKEKLIRLEKIFSDFLIENDLSEKKVKTLTNLIFINIAPLHTNPYSNFLYFLGIRGLNEIYDK